MSIFNTKFLRLSTLGLVITTFISLSLTSCSDDDGPTFLPNLPANGGDNVRMITHSGRVMTCYDWKFIYGGKRLLNAVGQIRDPQSDVDKSYSYSSNLKYGFNSVRIENSNREPVSVSLNSEGYIGNMKVGRNTYNFIYDNNRLVAWFKTIFEDSFGQATQYKTSASIKYTNNGDLEKIIVIGPDNQPVTTTFVPTNIENKNGLLPETVSDELGCLGFEHLYYAGLLGLPTKNLVKSITVSYADEAKKGYTIDFEYGTEGNNITLCNYHTDTNEIASVRYDY